MIRTYIKFLASLLFIFPSSGELRAKALRCGVATGFPPFQFTLDKKPVGLDVDVLKLLSPRISAGIEIVQAPWIDVLGAARFGQIDCIAGIEITPERQQSFDFTIPYYERTAVIVTLESNTSIRAIQDLHMKKVGSDLHSPIEDTLRQKQQDLVLRLVKVTEKDQAFHDLKKGAIAALILPRAVALYLSEKYQTPIKFIGEPIQKIPVAFAVKKGRQEILLQIQNELEIQMKQDLFKDILKKYGVK